MTTAGRPSGRPVLYGVKGWLQMARTYRVLMLGDVVGDSGIRAVAAGLPELARGLAPDLVVANGENAAGGFGLTREAADALFAAGVDLLTGGNHTWEKKGSAELLDADPRVLRPANYPPGAAGRGWARIEKGGASWLVLNLQGREWMKAIDCPFRCADAVLAAEATGPGRPLVVVDFHAESFQEKEALGLYLDGRASVVAGTHTHVQTMDGRVLPGGTAYLGDLGMCGPEDSVIGVKADICVRRNLTQMPLKMETSEGPSGLRGALFEIGEDGRCLALRPVRVDASGA